MDAKSSFFLIAKTPIIGELIIATAIYLILSLSFASMGYFGLGEEEKLYIMRIFLCVALGYIVCSLGYRVFTIMKKTR